MDSSVDIESVGSLIFFKKDGTEAPYPLCIGETTIGNSLDSDIRLKLKEELFMDIHCVINATQNGKVILINKSSEAPVILNGIPVKNSKVLRHEDTFELFGKKFQYLSNVPDIREKKNVLPNVERRYTAGPLLHLKTSKNSPKMKTPGRQIRRKSTESAKVIVSKALNVKRSPRRRASRDNPKYYSQDFLSHPRHSVSSMQEIKYSTPSNRKSTSAILVAKSLTDVQKNRTVTTSLRKSILIKSARKTGNLPGLSQSLRRSSVKENLLDKFDCQDDRMNIIPSLTETSDGNKTRTSIMKEKMNSTKNESSSEADSDWSELKLSASTESDSNISQNSKVDRNSSTRTTRKSSIKTNMNSTESEDDLIRFSDSCSYLSELNKSASTAVENGNLSNNFETKIDLSKSEPNLRNQNNLERYYHSYSETKTNVSSGKSFNSSGATNDFITKRKNTLLRTSRSSKIDGSNNFLFLNQEAQNQSVSNNASNVSNHSLRSQFSFNESAADTQDLQIFPKKLSTSSVVSTKKLNDSTQNECEVTSEGIPFLRSRKSNLVSINESPSSNDSMKTFSSGKLNLSNGVQNVSNYSLTKISYISEGESFNSSTNFMENPPRNIENSSFNISSTYESSSILKINKRSALSDHVNQSFNNSNKSKKQEQTFTVSTRSSKRISNLNQTPQILENFDNSSSSLQDNCRNSSTNIFVHASTPYSRTDKKSSVQIDTNQTLNRSIEREPEPSNNSFSQVSPNIQRRSSKRISNLNETPQQILFESEGLSDILCASTPYPKSNETSEIDVSTNKSLKAFDDLNIPNITTETSSKRSIVSKRSNISEAQQNRNKSLENSKTNLKDASFNRSLTPYTKMSNDLRSSRLKSNKLDFQGIAEDQDTSSELDYLENLQITISEDKNNALVRRVSRNSSMKSLKLNPLTIQDDFTLCNDLSIQTISSEDSVVIIVEDQSNVDDNVTDESDFSESYILTNESPIKSRRSSRSMSIMPDSVEKSIKSSFRKSTRNKQFLNKSEIEKNSTTNDDDSFKENRSNSIVRSQQECDVSLKPSETSYSSRVLKRRRGSSIGDNIQSKRIKVDSAQNISKLNSLQEASFVTCCSEEFSEASTAEETLTLSKYSKRLSNSVNTSKISESTPITSNSKFLNSSKNISSNITPKLISPKNEVINVAEVRKLRLIKTNKSPKNDLTNVGGIRKLMSTPKPVRSPKNDLTNIVGVKKLMSTPKYTKSPANDLTNVAGIKKLMSTPKVRNSPKNDLTNVAGVKKLMSTPKLVNSPKNDLTNVAGVKKLMSTPKLVNSPKNDLTNVAGVKKLMSTPKVINSPKNDLTRVAGVKKLMSTPKPLKSPKNDLTNVRGVKKLMSTPQLANSPKNDLSNVEGIAELFENRSEIDDNTDDLFTKLLDRKPLRTYRGKSISPDKIKLIEDSRKSFGDVPLTSPRVQDWIKEQVELKEKINEETKHDIQGKITRNNRKKLEFIIESDSQMKEHVEESKLDNLNTDMEVENDNPENKPVRSTRGRRKASKKTETQTITTKRVTRARLNIENTPEINENKLDNEEKPKTRNKPAIPKTENKNTTQKRTKRAGLTNIDNKNNIEIDESKPDPDESLTKKPKTRNNKKADSETRGSRKTRSKKNTVVESSTDEANVDTVTIETKKTRSKKNLNHVTNDESENKTATTNVEVSPKKTQNRRKINYVERNSTKSDPIVENSTKTRSGRNNTKKDEQQIKNKENNGVIESESTTKPKNVGRKKRVLENSTINFNEINTEMPEKSTTITRETRNKHNEKPEVKKRAVRSNARTKDTDAKSEHDAENNNDLTETNKKWNLQSDSPVRVTRSRKIKDDSSKTVKFSNNVDVKEISKIEFEENDGAKKSRAKRRKKNT